MPELKFFVLRDKNSIITYIFLKLANVERNWKIQKLKNSFEKLFCTTFGRRNWKIGTPLARWHGKLHNWHTFGRLAHLLARWYIKMKSWHSFGTLARGHVKCAITHESYDTWFSKLPYVLWKCKYDHKNYIYFYDMMTLRYLVIKNKFE